MTQCIGTFTFEEYQAFHLRITKLLTYEFGIEDAEEMAALDWEGDLKNSTCTKPDVLNFDGFYGALVELAAVWTAACGKALPPPSCCFMVTLSGTLRLIAPDMLKAFLDSLFL